MTPINRTVSFIRRNWKDILSVAALVVLAVLLWDGVLDAFRLAEWTL